MKTNWTMMGLIGGMIIVFGVLGTGAFAQNTETVNSQNESDSNTILENSDMESSGVSNSDIDNVVDTMGNSESNMVNTQSNGAQ